MNTAACLIDAALWHCTGIELGWQSIGICKFPLGHDRPEHRTPQAGRIYQSHRLGAPARMSCVTAHLAMKSTPRSPGEPGAGIRRYFRVGTAFRSRDGIPATTFRLIRGCHRNNGGHCPASQ